MRVYVRLKQNPLSPLGGFVFMVSSFTFDLLFRHAVLD